MNNIFKNEKFCWATIGAVAFTAGVQFLKSETFRKGCVKVVAGGMKLKKDAAASLEKVKEEAQDICFEAEAQGCTEDNE